MRYVLDTGVFYRPEALADLARTRIDVIVPSTVYMERVRQLRKNGLSAETFRLYLTESQFELEPFADAHADRYAARILDDGLWGRLYRDAMIAGHVGDEDVLWTTNPKDFLAVGLEAHQVVGV